MEECLHQGAIDPGAGGRWHARRHLAGTSPITCRRGEKTGYDGTATYAGCDASDVAKAIPEAAGTDANGVATPSDRALIAAPVNAVKQQQAELDELRAKIEGAEVKWRGMPLPWSGRYA
ncbi:MAG: hypothetical protein FJ148_10090 [Deltaproteobacteria bacterium]|nr:hypothetical protein [Deltaproteobacteria bacterium]